VWKSEAGLRRCGAQYWNVFGLWTRGQFIIVYMKNFKWFIEYQYINNCVRGDWFRNSNDTSERCVLFTGQQLSFRYPLLIPPMTLVSALTTEKCILASVLTITLRFTINSTPTAVHSSLPNFTLIVTPILMESRWLDPHPWIWGICSGPKYWEP